VVVPFSRPDGAALPARRYIATAIADCASR
jgi:hypothetical protein